MLSADTLGASAARAHPARRVCSGALAPRRSLTGWRRGRSLRAAHLALRLSTARSRTRPSPRPAPPLPAAGSYGSLARFTNLRRIRRVGDYTLVAGSGEYSDFQTIMDLLHELV